MPLLSSNAQTWLLALLGLTLGCSSAPELETWPVKGAVVDQTGASLTSGVVRFFASDEMHQSDPHLITAGPIRPDGTFIVKTHRKDFTYDGAVAGEYRLMVMTDKKTPAGERVPVQYELPESSTVEPRENTLAIKIQR
jgi:hypothetical protein